jgi:hypothetical protein
MEFVGPVLAFVAVIAVLAVMRHSDRLPSPQPFKRADLPRTAVAGFAIVAAWVGLSFAAGDRNWKGGLFVLAFMGAIFLGVGLYGALRKD